MNREQIGILATCPQVMASVALMHAAMDEVGDYASVNYAIRDSLTDDQVDALAAESELAASAEQLEDVRHDMRVCWNEALASLGGLNPPKLPTVAAGKIVMLTFPEVLALCGETNHLYVLLANVLRGASADVLHLHLRTTWIDGFCQELADMGWAA